MNQRPDDLLFILHPSSFIIHPSRIVPVGEPGVPATLSRWRSRVQIPLGTLDGTVRKPAKRPSSNLGDRLWVRLPPVLLSIPHEPAAPARPVLALRAHEEKRDASAGHWR